jgi:phospholipid/cholesterol/gamma-HCH transport system substrate-binding protein
VLPRRIYLNLAAFVLLFAALSAWAVQNVLRPDLLEDTYDVTAEFADATGLRTGVEVTLRGLRIGRVSTVRIVPGRAEVVLSIDADAELPNGSGAAIRRRSAVGEPYVAIEVPTGWQPGDGSIPTMGHRIPLESTSTPLAYGDLFTAADSLLAAVDPADLGVVTSELATALGGRGEELAQLTDDTSDAITTLARGQAEFRVLGENLTTFTRTIADRSPTIADAIDDLGVVVDSVAANTDDLQTILANAPTLASRVDAILTAGYADALCAADATATIGTAIGTDETVARIAELLRAAETASVVVPQAIYEGPDGRYLSGTFGFAPGELNAYNDFQEFETPPALATCEGAAPPAGEPVPASATDGGTAATEPPTDVARSDGPAESSGGATVPSAAATTGSASSWLPVAAAATLVIAVAVGVIAGLGGRIRRRGRIRDGGTKA